MTGAQEHAGTGRNLIHDPTGKVVFEEVEPAPGAELNSQGEEFYPEGLAAVVREAWAGAGVPVFVTENGMAAPDAMGPADVVQDADRIAYLSRHLQACRQAIAADRAGVAAADRNCGR